MATSLDRLAVREDTYPNAAERREARIDMVRIVEYTRFPRAGEDSTQRIAFTRDVSPSGMCIGADEPEIMGALLRVTLRGVDGAPGPAVVDRVVWCSPAYDGRWWIGLESLTEKHLS